MNLKEIYEKYHPTVLETGIPVKLTNPNNSVFAVSLVKFKRNSTIPEKVYFLVEEITSGKKQLFCPALFSDNWNIEE